MAVLAGRDLGVIGFFAAIISLLMLLAAALAPGAHASTAAVTGTTLTITETTLDEANSITVSREATPGGFPAARRYRITEGSVAQAFGAGCGFDGSDVVCTDTDGFTAMNAITEISASLGGANDDIALAGPLLPPGDPSSLSGGAGNDVLTGGPGPDTLLGGAGGDDLTGGGGTDTASYADHDDFAYVAIVDIGAVSALDPHQPSGCSGFDDGMYSMDDNGGCRDNVRDDIENLLGGPQPDFLTGNGNANTLDGGDSSDTLDGGTGADILEGGDGTDTVSYLSRTASVMASIDDGPNDGESGEGDDIRGVENLTGGSGNDILSGNAAENRLAGAAGDDRLVGAGEEDLLIGGEGADLLVGGGNEDQFHGQAGADNIQSMDGIAEAIVDCGADLDTATVDLGLDTPSDCETLLPDVIAPNTSLGKSTVKKTKGKATFSFFGTDNNPQAVSFLCKIDKKPFGACTSPKTYKKLKNGKHTFQGVAVDVAGNQDASPIVKKFKIKRP